LVDSIGTSKKEEEESYFSLLQERALHAARQQNSEGEDGEDGKDGDSSLFSPIENLLVSKVYDFILVSLLSLIIIEPLNS